ncbi:MAG: hypothetical protein WA397_20460 [Roseiarcus sp.]
MIRIAITAEAFEAIAATLPSGNVLYERERTPHGGYFVWLDESAANNLERLRGPRDEDLSAVIVRYSASMLPTNRSTSCFAASRVLQKKGRNDPHHAHCL